MGYFVSNNGPRVLPILLVERGANPQLDSGHNSFHLLLLKLFLKDVVEKKYFGKRTR